MRYVDFQNIVVFLRLWKISLKYGRGIAREIAKKVFNSADM